MKKTILSTTLLALLCPVIHANQDNATTPLAAAVDAKTPIPATVATAQGAQAPALVNCKMHIAADVTKIEDATLSSWAEKATVQSFDFNPQTIDNQLDELKLCYTDQGWQGFNDALQKSGNLTAIKSQQLSVSSQVNGTIDIRVVKNNQWKATVPIQVVYQNDKEKLTQLLTIDLLIGRKMSGDLGIMQLIATPHQPGGQAQPTADATVKP